MDQDERDDLARYLFAVVTGMLEDAAGIAAQVQNKGDRVAPPVRAAQIESITLQAVSIVRTAAALPYD